MDPSCMHLYQWLSFVVRDFPCIFFWLVYVCRYVVTQYDVSYLWYSCTGDFHVLGSYCIVTVYVYILTINSACFLLFLIWWLMGSLLPSHLLQAILRQDQTCLSGIKLGAIMTYNVGSCHIC